MSETLLNVALAVAILGASALITHLFTRAMYITCPKCRTLNARRRKHCRKCGCEFTKPANEPSLMH